MQLISYSFVLLWMLAFSLYYLVPKKMQWYVLLGAGIVFYVIGLRAFPLNLLLTGITTYGCGIFLNAKLKQERDCLNQCADKEHRKEIKAKFRKKRKRIQVLHIAFNLGLLAFYKYAAVVLPFAEAFAGSGADFLEKVVMPLGISFYTLTAVSYVIDVGRENCRAETDFLKVLLFLSYFPSVTQGPFNRYTKLKEQFESEHCFQYDGMLRGIQRFVWGAFKKLVIADRIGIFVDRVYGVEGAFVSGSIFACATVFYMLQLYADFSGYIDMAAGVSETFGIVLPDNFKRPYFSKSVAEFWRRWHITLGTWFKDYVMFSFVMSGAGRRIGKACKNKWNGLGKQAAPIIGTMLVWFLTGIWHGRNLGYMLWGLYYGMLMSSSLLLESQYGVWKEKFRIREGRIWDLFCMARTWLIVFLADVMIRSKSIEQAGAVYASFVTRLNLGALLSGEAASYGLGRYDFIVLSAALLIWFSVSILEERGHDVRMFLSEKPVAIRWACYYGIVVFLLVTGIYGGSYDTTAFMYQSF